MQRKRRKCKQCGKLFEVKTILQYLCGWDCLQIYNSAKEIKKRESDAKRVVRYENLKQRAIRVFQAWIRRRDSGLGCISCGMDNPKDAGHYFAKHLYTDLIFDEVNTNSQCAFCNNYLGGNPIQYRMGLIEKYGENTVRDLESRAKPHRAFTFTREYLTKIINTYK